MKIKTFFGLLLLLIIGLTSTSCGTPKVGENPSSVAEAEEILAKKKKRKPIKFIGKSNLRKLENR